MAKLVLTEYQAIKLVNIINNMISIALSANKSIKDNEIEHPPVEAIDLLLGSLDRSIGECDFSEKDTFDGLDSYFKVISDYNEKTIK